MFSLPNPDEYDPFHIRFLRYFFLDVVRHIVVKLQDAVRPVSFIFAEQFHVGDVDIPLAEAAGDVCRYADEVSVVDVQLVVLARELVFDPVDSVDPDLSQPQHAALRAAVGRLMDVVGERPN